MTVSNQAASSDYVSLCSHSVTSICVMLTAPSDALIAKGLR